MATALQIQSTMTEVNGKKQSFGHEIKVSFRGATHHRTIVAMQNRNCTRSNNFYEVLSLDSSKNLGHDEIKRAYRSKALKFHPDTCSPSTKEESTRRFLEIKMAYETLSDPISREIYDHELSLVDRDGIRKHGMVGGRAHSGFSREVWQKQLSGLKNRSSQRLGMK